MTLDTGCARDFIRESFRNQLEKASQTKSSLLLRQEGDRAIQCTGITKEMETAPVAFHTTVKLIFKDVPEDGTKGKKDVPVEVIFGELKEACDVLLVGFPTMLKWGTDFWADDDGLPWVTLKAFGITMPCERPGES